MVLLQEGRDVISVETAKCSNCLDMSKFGGSGRKRQCCEKIKCIEMRGIM